MATTSGGIPYVGPTQYSEPADFPAIDEDQAIAIQGLITTLQNQIAAMQPLLVPTGTIVAYGGNSAPTGWLLCNGAAIAGTYSALIALVGANTPNLINRFIVGGGMSGNDSTGQANLYSVRSSGQPGPTTGQITLTQAQTPVKAHSHAVSLGNADTNHVHSLTAYGVGDHAHGISATQALGPYNGANQDQIHHYVSTNIWDYRSYTWTASGTHGAGGHSHGGNTNWQSENSADWGGPRYTHNHSVSQGNGGDATASAVDIRPPWYALVYIIKT